MKHGSAADSMNPCPPSDRSMTERTEVLSWLNSFVPHPWLLNGHLQTIVGNFLPRPAFRLPSESEMVEVDPADRSRVLCHCHWQPKPVRSERPTAILVHGLEGSSNSRYVRGIAARAFAAGMNVIRMNMRTCGGTEALTPTLYHSGRSSDVAAVVRYFAARYDLSRVALVGYSMGGNLVLKMAGECGSEFRELLSAVATVCPAIDLAAGSDALHETRNRPYESHFLRNLMRRFRRKAALFPDVYLTRGLGPIRSIREFDQKIVATYCGFLSADDYYYRAASARVIDRIKSADTYSLCRRRSFYSHSSANPCSRSRESLDHICRDALTAAIAHFWAEAMEKMFTGRRPQSFVFFKSQRGIFARTRWRERN